MHKLWIYVFVCIGMFFACADHSKSALQSSEALVSQESGPGSDLAENDSEPGDFRDLSIAIGPKINTSEAYEVVESWERGDVIQAVQYCAQCGALCFGYAADGNYFYACQRDDGTILFNLELPGRLLAAPTFDEQGNSFLALDGAVAEVARTGKLLRTKPAAWSLESSRQSAFMALTPRFSPSAGKMQVGFLEVDLGNTSASQGQQGELEEGSSGQALEVPAFFAVLSDGYQVLGTDKTVSYADPQGAVEWRFQVQQALSDGLALFGEQFLFAADKVYSLNKAGTLLWTADVAKYLGGTVLHGPVIDDFGSFYLASSSSLAAFSELGRVLWVTRELDEAMGPITLSSGRVYLCGKTKLAILSEADGTLLWQTAAPFIAGAQVTIAGNAVYAGTSDGRLLKILRAGD